MEEASNKARQAIGQMIADLPSLATFSVKRDVRFWNIRIEIKPDAVSTPGVKKKKPSPSRLRRNQRRLRMFLERNKSAGSGEPDISGMKVTSAGELPASKGADSTPVKKLDGPALSTLETREDVSKQIPSPANTEEEGTDNDICSTHDDARSSEQDISGKGEDNSSEEESKDDIVPGVDQEKKEIAMMLKEMYAECVKLKATMDLIPEDSVLPIQAKKAVKVPANIIENSAVTRQYVTVKRKRKNLADPNSCKTT